MAGKDTRPSGAIALAPGDRRFVTVSKRLETNPLKGSARASSLVP
jgi:hypothetical protein